MYIATVVETDITTATTSNPRKMMKFSNLLHRIDEAALAFDAVLEDLMTPKGFDPNAIELEDLPQVGLYLLRVLPIIALAGASIWFLIVCAFCL